MKKLIIIKWALFIIVIAVLILIFCGKSNIVVSALGGASLAFWILMNIHDFIKYIESELSEDNEYPENVGGIDD